MVVQKKLKVKMNLNIGDIFHKLFKNSQLATVTNCYLANLMLTGNLLLHSKSVLLKKLVKLSMRAVSCVTLYR